MKQLLLISLCLSVGHLCSQNLVLNPSFEDYFDCPKGISFFHQNVKNWTIPNNGTTDYYNSCSEKTGFDNFMGFQTPKTGSGYAGIYVYSKGNYKEYIQGKLSITLERDKIYNITCYVSLSEKSSHAIADFQMLFTTVNLTSYSSDYIDLEPLINPMTLAKSIAFTTDDFIIDSTDWVKLTIHYKASGFENYFTLGNFDSNSKLEKIKVKSQKGKPSSYYYVDDISIESMKKIKPIEIPLVKEEDTGFESDKIYVFDDVLFDFDEAILLTELKVQLDKLSEYLKNHPKITVEVYGHTDVVGSQKRNKDLSIERAKSVSEYLILRGLEPSRIRWLGFGSAQPIATNETEDGRAQNRRVEFKLTDN